MDYDKIYGISLDEYLKRQGKTRKQLAKEIKIDLEILNENYQKYAQRNETLTDDELSLVMEIRKLIEKKRKHLERIKKWT